MGRILALDLGKVTGFASGKPGERPLSGSMRLASAKESREVTFWNLIAWLQKEFEEDKPSLVITEAPPTPAALQFMKNAGFTIRATLGYHGIVEGMCAGYAIRKEEANMATARKFFTGKGKHGSREATKAASIEQCHQRGLMPLDCRDENRADALAVWKWAEAHCVLLRSAA